MSPIFIAKALAFVWLCWHHRSLELFPDSPSQGQGLIRPAAVVTACLPACLHGWCCIRAAC